MRAALWPAIGRRAELRPIRAAAAAPETPVREVEKDKK
jgi:hypothetical protein